MDDNQTVLIWPCMLSWRYNKSRWCGGSEGRRVGSWRCSRQETWELSEGAPSHFQNREFFFFKIRCENINLIEVNLGIILLSLVGKIGCITTLNSADWEMNLMEGKKINVMNKCKWYALLWNRINVLYFSLSLSPLPPPLNNNIYANIV